MVFCHLVCQSEETKALAVTKALSYSLKKAQFVFSSKFNRFFDTKNLNKKKADSPLLICK